MSLDSLCFHTNLPTHWPDDNQLSAVTRARKPAAWEREWVTTPRYLTPKRTSKRSSQSCRCRGCCEDQPIPAWHKSNLYYDALQHQVLVVWFITSCFKMGDVQLAVSTWYCRGSVTVHTRQIEEVIIPRSKWPLNRRLFVHPSWSGNLLQYRFTAGQTHCAKL
jgi:hypothetical protein